MKGILVLWLALVLASEAAGATTKTEAEVCPVCRVTRGETEAEPVKAKRTHGGREYGFCSEKCASAFEADPAGYMPPAFPRPVPAFAVTDLDGSPIAAADLKGRVALVDFWATWCAPCAKAMPALQRLHERLAGRGFTVIGISIDEGEAEAVKRFVRSKKITYPIAVDSKEAPAWEAFRVKVVPSAYLVDRAGRIVAQWTGAPATPEEIEAEVEKLLAPKTE